MPRPSRPLPPPKPRTGPPPTRADLTLDQRPYNGAVYALVPKPLLLEAERQAAHELKSMATYVRQALLEKVLRDIDAEKTTTPFAIAVDRGLQYPPFGG